MRSAVLLGHTIFPRRKIFERKHAHACAFRLASRCFFLRKSREQWPLCNAFYLAYEPPPILLSPVFTCFPFSPRSRTRAVEYATWKTRVRKRTPGIIFAGIPLEFFARPRFSFRKQRDSPSSPWKDKFCICGITVFGNRFRKCCSLHAIPIDTDNDCIIFPIREH